MYAAVKNVKDRAERSILFKGGILFQTATV